MCTCIFIHTILALSVERAYKQWCLSNSEHTWASRSYIQILFFNKSNHGPQEEWLVLELVLGQDKLELSENAELKLKIFCFLSNLKINGIEALMKHILYIISLYINKSFFCDRTYDMSVNRPENII